MTDLGNWEIWEDLSMQHEMPGGGLWATPSFKSGWQFTCLRSRHAVSAKNTVLNAEQSAGRDVITFSNKANLVPVRWLGTLLKSDWLSGCVYSLKYVRANIYSYIFYFLIISFCILMPSLLHSWSLWAYSGVKVDCFIVVKWAVNHYFVIN